MEWILVGSRLKSKPVTDEVFSELWQNSRSAQALLDIGVEAPEQLGALFLADASFLNSWTEQAEILEDNYPYRISSQRLSGAEFSLVLQKYREVMKVDDVVERFYQSDWIKKFWPEGMRLATRAYFPFQKAWNRYFDYSRQRTGIAEIHEVLEGSSLRALPLAFFQLSYSDFAIIDTAFAAGVISPEINFAFASRAMADRNYPEAVQLLENALRMDPGSVMLAQLRIFALLQAGEVEAARAAAGELRRRAPTGGFPDFWEWFAALEETEEAAAMTRKR
jgi:hypothetical protein